MKTPRYVVLMSLIAISADNDALFASLERKK
jgi:hypothetical protein